MNEVTLMPWHRKNYEDGLQTELQARAARLGLRLDRVLDLELSGPICSCALQLQLGRTSGDDHGRESVHDVRGWTQARLSASAVRCRHFGAYMVL